MLTNMSKLLTGDLLKILCDMGHGDTIVIADGNFPGETMGKRVIHMPGIDATAVLKAIAPVFPLDVAYSEFPAQVMEMTDSDKAKGLPEPAAYADFKAALNPLYPDLELGKIERFAFYEKAKNAYAVIMTGEERIYGNLLLTKGVVL